MIKGLSWEDFTAVYRHLCVFLYDCPSSDVVQWNKKGDTENLYPVKTVTVRHANEKVICIVSGA